MKVVDLVTRNSGKLSLYFSDFSTIFNGFYKFAVLGRQRNSNLQTGPSRIKTICRTAPGRSWNRGGGSRRSCSLAARVPWGEQHEEAKSYLGMCSVDRGVAEIGVAGV